MAKNREVKYTFDSREMRMKGTNKMEKVLMDNFLSNNSILSAFKQFECGSVSSTFPVQIGNVPKNVWQQFTPNARLEIKNAMP